MNKKEVKKIVLETIIECFEDMSCYADEGDVPLNEFVREAEQKLDKLNQTR